MLNKREDLTKDLQRILYCINNSSHYTSLDYEDFVEQFNGLFYQSRFKTKDQFNENCQLESIRGCVVVVVVCIGLCTRKDIIEISKYSSVHSIFIYDPGRESTDSISTFQTEKFRGIFQQQNELINRICRIYYTIPPAASIRDTFVARFKVLSKPNENIQTSDTDQAEQVAIVDVSFKISSRLIFSRTIRIDFYCLENRVIVCLNGWVVLKV